MTKRHSESIVVSISGGRSSAMMARHIQTHPKYDNFQKAYIFANTGMERPETIEFLRKCEKHWGIEIIKVEGVYSSQMGVGVNYQIKEWDELDMEAKVFEQAVMHKNKGTYDGLPNSSAPYCSEVLKKIPIQKCANDLFGRNNYIMAIGMRHEDTPHRISMAEARASTKIIYPLLLDFQYPRTQNDITKFWNEQPFKLEIHNKLGNCELCWKKSDKNLVEVIRHGTRFVDWWKRMEEKYNNTPFRGKKSIDYYVKLSKLPVEEQINFDSTSDSCVCNFNETYDNE